MGSVGALMAGSGLEEILSSVFVGLDKMLLGLKFPMNLRALRLTVIELVRGYVEEMRSYDEMQCWFAQLRKASVLSEC